MKQKQVKNVCIEFCRIFWTFYIIMMHGKRFLPENLQNYLIGGYIGVEFFFMVSGFYIAKKAKSNESVQNYFVNRLNRLYPHYFGGIFILILLSFITANSGLRWDLLNRLLINALCLQHFTKQSEIVISPYMWYVVYLIIFGTILYAARKYVRKEYQNFFAVIFCGTFYFLSFWLNKSVNGATASLNFVKILPIPAYRAIADLLLGTLCYDVYCKFDLKKINTNLI